MPTSMSVLHCMQKGPVPDGSTGHAAQFLSSVGPVPRASYNEQAVQAGVDYRWQVPREALASYLPLPPFREPGMC